MAVITRGLIINGKEKAARNNRMTDDISPWTGAVYARIAAASPEDVNAAADAAAAAFPAWSEMRPFERRKIFLRAADLMEQRAEEAIELMAREVGGARPWAKFNTELCAEILREAAAAITQPTGQILATNAAGSQSYAERMPYGVIAAISPWNAPFILGIRSIAIPLAMGNCVVMKPSEDAPISCGLYLAEILHEAGLPAGVLNVVTNDPRDAGLIVETLIGHPQVRLVNFTGSTHVGRLIGIEAAKNIKPAILELGGKNALVVLKAADIDYAVEAAIFGAFMNSGQICMSTDRIIVEREIADDFIGKLANAANKIIYGDPANPGTVVGPVVNGKSALRISTLIKDAVDKGAKLLAGSGEIEGQAGTLLKPILLTDVNPDMAIFYNEIFGPAAVIHVVDSVSEAIALANDTDYGLTGGVISEDIRAAMNVARQMKTGIVHVNGQGIGDEPMAPFGGIKNTGYGHFGGQSGMEAFTVTRWVTVKERGHEIP
ncbi:aldehyde dehydrogenase family protein [Serratia proteamaculans]|uniref:Aldehyde dehydrogenase family protein n=1 Tax=Serratia proteamaculans TaxID=28151 RepID=A0A5Q2VFA6_SERPR|nr:aldehyde dehydrogenase family protein [Serratia proteamaculans]QGH62665.1 aldehyde dehydrogenase family protein [Serratia proteamaculans]